MYSKHLLLVNENIYSICFSDFNSKKKNTYAFSVLFNAKGSLRFFFSISNPRPASLKIN